MEELLPLVKCAEFLAQKYDVVVTNPPYMAVSNAGAKVNDYVKKNFPDSKADMFAVFIERCGQMAKKNGYQAMITQYVWMYKTVYKDFRYKMLRRQIINMLHLGTGAFDEIAGEVVNTTAFVMGQCVTNDFRSTFVRLVDYPNEASKNAALLNRKEIHTAIQERFTLVPENIYAYWVSEKVYQTLIAAPTLDDVAFPRKGLTTGDNETFVRLWYEISQERFSIYQDKAKWFPMTKGGDFRKWFGNNCFVIDWEDGGFALRNFRDENGKSRSVLRNTQFYFKEGISWNDTGSGDLAFRYQDNSFIPNASGPCVYSGKVDVQYLIGLFNSKVSRIFMGVLAPALKFEVGQVARYPIIYSEKDSPTIVGLDNQCIAISECNWDSYETSWNFKRNPLV